VLIQAVDGIGPRQIKLSTRISGHFTLGWLTADELVWLSDAKLLITWVGRSPLVVLLSCCRGSSAVKKACA